MQFWQWLMSCEHTHLHNLTITMTIEAMENMEIIVMTVTLTLDDSKKLIQFKFNSVLMLFISDFIALYSWFKHEYLKRNLISLCYHGLIIHLAKKVCIGLIWGRFSISLGFFSQFWAQISPIYSHRTSTFLTKGLLYIFFQQSKLIWTYNSILQKYQNISTKKYHFYFLWDRGSFSWFSAHTFPICSFSIFSSEGYCAFYFYQADFIYPSKSILGR